MEANFRNLAGLDGKRIIVVEDDAVLALDISDQLRDIGATVLGPAPTAYYALQLIGPERRRLDGAVLDIQLHGKTVYEFADVLTERQVPFLFATALDRKSIPPRFEHAPILKKPVPPEALAAAVKEMVLRPPVARVTLPVPPEIAQEVPVVVFARVVARTLNGA